MDEEQKKKAQKTLVDELLRQEANPDHGDDEIMKKELELELEIEEAALSSLDTEIILLRSKSELLDTKYEWREICAANLTEKIMLLKRKIDMLREFQPAPSSTDLLEQLSRDYSETKHPNRFCTYILNPEAAKAKTDAWNSWVTLDKARIEMVATDMGITFKSDYIRNELVDEILTLKEERGEPLAKPKPKPKPKRKPKRK